MPAMSLFGIATAAHLAGTLVLALFFVLLRRHDARPYLRDWTAAWGVQAVALATLLLVAPRDVGLGVALYLFLETAHGVLLFLAARGYAQNVGRPSPARLLLILPLAAWAAAAPRLFADERALHAAQYVALAATSLGAAAVLWRLREPIAMGVRLTTNVLVLLGALHLAHAALFAWAARHDAETHPLVEATPFQILLLQMLLALSMVLTVMEAAQLALHVTNAQLGEAQRRLKVLAETDPLTGCFNRRVFRDLVDELRAGGGREQGVVVLLDMDGLKAVNDREGHAAGDAAIRALADALRTVTRNTDLLVRWGGDEFVVVLPGVAAAEGVMRRDQIVSAVAAAGLSASAGLAPYGEGVDIMAAVEDADRRMYALKAERKLRAATARVR